MKGETVHFCIARNDLSCILKCVKTRFVQVYLASASVILGVTALGKAIPVHHYDWCVEQPILGPLQFGLPNPVLLWITSGY